MIKRILQWLGNLYAALYALLCGRHPSLRLWHSQWSAQHFLSADLRATLPLLEGRLLDVGCGAKPYRRWCAGATDYVGVDIVPGPAVDWVIQPGRPWPLASASFDGLLCTQVLEHATDPVHLVDEMARVLRPGGLAVISAPFLYPAQGSPPDYRRFSAEGLRLLLGTRFQVTSLRREGGIGSTLALLILGWIEAYTTHSRIARLLKVSLLPFWIALCGALNLGGVLLDSLDPTHAFYGNVLVVAMRKPD